MLWSIVQAALSVFVAAYAARKDAANKTVYLVLVLVIVGVGVASILKDRADARSIDQLQQQTSDLKKQVEDSEGELKAFHQAAIEKISGLQSKVDNAELRKQLGDVKKELEATRNPPRAHLAFGFEGVTPDATLLKIMRVIRPANDILSLRLVVKNDTPNLDAQDVDIITFFLPEGSQLLDEEAPKRLKRNRDSPPNVWSFEHVGRIGVNGMLTAFRIKVKVPQMPPGQADLHIGFRYSCSNCKAGDLQHITVVMVPPELSSEEQTR